MFTYSLWLGIISEFTIYTTIFEKMAWYSFCAFLTPVTFALDLCTSLFQLIGILIYFIVHKVTGE